MRAKFTVVSVERNWHGSEKVILSAVYSADENSENRAFWTATPSGKLEMVIDNPEVMGRFEPGEEYYLDLQLAVTALVG